MSLANAAMEAPEKLFHIMDLPVKIRNKILGKLLPNRPEIKVHGRLYERDKHNLYYDTNYRYHVTYRDDDEQCHTTILHVSQKLYKEESEIMYNRVFKITIDDDGVAFLKHHHGKNPINILLEFPWHEAKQLRIVLWGVDFQERLFQLRANLVAVTILATR